MLLPPWPQTVPDPQISHVAVGRAPLRNLTGHDILPRGGL